MIEPLEKKKLHDWECVNDADCGLPTRREMFDKINELIDAHNHGHWHEVEDAITHDSVMTYDSGPAIPYEDTKGGEHVLPSN